LLLPGLLHLPKRHKNRAAAEKDAKAKHNKSLEQGWEAWLTEAASSVLTVGRVRVRRRGTFRSISNLSLMVRFRTVQLRLEREAQIEAFGRALRQTFADIAAEPLPDPLRELLERFDKLERRDKQDARRASD